MIATTLALDAVADKWREFIVVDTAIKMLGKEESDTSLLERRRANLEKRINEAAAARDVGRSMRIQDVRRGRWEDEEL